MKVGILTFHNAYNYGAVLQAYATQAFLKQLGHNVEIIDYRNKWVDSDYDIQKFSIKRMPKRAFYKAPSYIAEKILYSIRRRKFNHFKRCFLNIGSQRYKDKSEIILDCFDAILIGSDQLWNKTITRGFDDVYWGSFSSSSKTRVVSWAVSMNLQSLDDDDILYIKDHLSNFDAISVRESLLRERLLKITRTNIHVLLDPVFLVPKDNWTSLCKDVTRKNYVLVYAMLYKEQAISFARSIASLHKKNIVIINTYSGNSPASKEVESLGPIEFLSYLKYADCIITTSFHGCAFSLIFKKCFYCIEPKGSYNLRAHSLLKQFDEEKRIVSGDSIPSDIEDITDSSRIDETIKTNVSYTESFLRSIL